MSGLEAVLQQITDSFEAKDADAFAAHLLPEFSWVNPDGSIFCANKEEFMALVLKYWSENPSLKSELSTPLISGNFATQSETASGFEDGHEEKYLWVYEFNADHKLVKQWGFMPNA